MTTQSSIACPTCGLKPWDADDLQPGDFVCTCDDPFEDDADDEAEVSA